MQSKIVEIALVDGVEIYADDDATYKSLDLFLPQLQGLMPHAEKVWVEALLENVGNAEIDWNIEAYSGYNETMKDQR